MKRIVISPIGVRKDLYSKYRNEDIFSNVKFLSKEEFIQNATYIVSSDAILFLVDNYNFDYSRALKFLNQIAFLTTSNDEKSAFALKIKNELIDLNYLIKNEYFEYELNNSIIDIYYYGKNDKEISLFLENKTVNYFDYDISNDLSIYEFENYETELITAFDKISDLINRGVSPNNIYLYGVIDCYSSLFLRLKKHYGFNFNNEKTKKYIDLIYVREFIDELPTKNIDDLLEKLNEKYSEDANFKKFVSIAKTYYLKSGDKNKQIRLYKDIFASKNIPSIRYKEAINIASDPYVPKNSYLFIVNFITGRFPKIYQNDGYFSDKEAISLGLISLEEKNLSLSEYFISSLRLDINLYISFSHHDGGKNNFVSFLVKQLGMKTINKIVMDKTYSKNEAMLRLAKSLDIKKYYRIKTDDYLRLSGQLEIPYCKYDSSFKGVEHFQSFNVVELSYSSTKLYYQCAFRYYLQYILKLDKETNDSSAMAYGNFAHEIFENIENIPIFEDNYNEIYKRYQDKWTKKDELFLEIKKPHLKKAYEFIISFEKQITNPSIYREMQIKNKLSDRITVQGYIDKLIISGNSGEYISIIDYKTGKEEFSPNLLEYGLSLQLPAYSYLLKENENYKNKNIIGLFIEPVINQKAVKTPIDDDKYIKELELKGIFLNDVDAIKSIDSSLNIGYESNYIYGAKVKNNEFYSSGNALKRYVDEDQFVQFSQLAKQLFLDAGNKILNNEFPINPKKVKGNDQSCQYCTFKDICFRKQKDYVLLDDEEIDDE